MRVRTCTRVCVCSPKLNQKEWIVIVTVRFFQYSTNAQLLGQYATNESKQLCRTHTHTHTHTYTHTHTHTQTHTHTHTRARARVTHNRGLHLSNRSITHSLCRHHSHPTPQLHHVMHMKSRRTTLATITPTPPKTSNSVESHLDWYLWEAAPASLDHQGWSAEQWEGGSGPLPSHSSPFSCPRESQPRGAGTKETLACIHSSTRLHEHRRKRCVKCVCLFVLHTFSRAQDWGGCGCHLPKVLSGMPGFFLPKK